MRVLWQRLLSTERLSQGDPNDIQRGRNEFDLDLNRIVFSSHFRRMKNKTQVFPMSPSDYTRVRLIHTLEVTSVGRNLGRIVGKLQRSPDLAKQAEEPTRYEPVLIFRHIGE